MAIQNPKPLISIDEYHRLAEDGLFSEGVRVELIEGEIVERAPWVTDMLQPCDG